MTISKRRGKRGDTYNYRFMLGGKLYYGVCRGCPDRESSEKYEKELKETILEASRQRTVTALVENFRERLERVEGKTRNENINDVFGEFLKNVRGGKCSEKELAAKKSRWLDFVNFCVSLEITKISEITEKICERYIVQITTKGRFSGCANYTRKRKTGTKKKVESSNVCTGGMSPETANKHIKTCREILHSVGCGAFDGVKMVRIDRTGREAFSMDEVRRMIELGDSDVTALVITGMYTGLRRGDICRLKWADVDWDGMTLSVVTHKTGKRVRIPIARELKELFFSRLYNGTEYIFPALEERIRFRPETISRIFKGAMEKCGIKSRVSRGDGRRAGSIKDIHSLRHTFCYLAGVAGIPLNVVQGIVGHMDSRMTELYSAHSTDEDRRRGIAAMERIING